jgi:hypothetical protein
LPNERGTEVSQAHAGVPRTARQHEADGQDHDGNGLKFEILTGTTFVSWKTFEVDDVVVIKQAFVQVGKKYPGDIIHECVAVLLGLRA